MSGISITRRIGEKILIGKHIVCRVEKIEGSQVSLEFDGPEYIPIWRYELKNKWAQKIEQLEEREKQLAKNAHSRERMIKVIKQTLENLNRQYQAGMHEGLKAKLQALATVLNPIVMMSKPDCQSTLIAVHDGDYIQGVVTRFIHGEVRIGKIKIEPVVALMCVEEGNAELIYDHIEVALKQCE